jgi:flagellar L-ring protein precursor FlgH
MIVRSQESGVRGKRLTFHVSRLTFLSFFTFYFSLFTLIGCAGTPKKAETKLPEQSAREEARTEGSLWIGETSRSSLFADTKAKGVGDILTIRVTESSKGSKSASTDTSRESSTSAGITDFFGAPLDFGLKKLYGSRNGTALPFSPTVAADSSSSFKGDGNTSRSSLLEADITARVANVLPNGNLEIEGRREIVVNNEDQVMILRGIIRPEDISSSNVILSTYIADARIEYTGKGILADKQGPGWFTRILDKVWPF